MTTQQREGLGADLGEDAASLQVGATRLNEIASEIDAKALDAAADLADPVERRARELEVVHAELGKLVGKQS